MLPDTRLRQTLTYNFQQFHLPFHLQFVLWICSLKIHSETRRQNPFPYSFRSPCVSLLCMFSASVFAVIPDHEVRAAKLTNRWTSGCWWGRNASFDEHLVRTKHVLLLRISSKKTTWRARGLDVKRMKLEEESGILTWKWYSGVSGPTLEPRRHVTMPTTTAPMELPTVFPPAPPPEEHVPEMRVHGNSGGGEVAAKKEMMICDTSYADSYVPISYLPNKDG